MIKENMKQLIEEYLRDSMNAKNFEWYTLINNWGVKYESGLENYDSFYHHKNGFSTSFSLRSDFGNFVSIGGRRSEELKMKCKMIDYDLNKLLKEGD